MFRERAFRTVVLGLLEITKHLRFYANFFTVLKGPFSGRERGRRAREEKAKLHAEVSISKRNLVKTK